MLTRRSRSFVSPLLQLLSAMRPCVSNGSVGNPSGAARGLHAAPAPPPAARSYHNRAARYTHVRDDLQQLESAIAMSAMAVPSSHCDEVQQLESTIDMSTVTLASSHCDDAQRLESSIAAPRMAIASSHCYGASSTSYQVYNVEELTSTWLSHWRQHEERLQFRKAVLRATRGRQMQRHRQLTALVASHQPIMEAEDPAMMDATAILVAAIGAADALTTGTGSTQHSRTHPLRDLAQHSSTPTSKAPACRVSGAAGRSIELGRSRMSDAEWLYGLPDEAEVAQQAVDWLPTGSSDEGGTLGPQRLRLNGEGVTIRPLWICVFQEEGSQEARLFESVVPLEEAVLRHLQAPLSPFCTTTKLQFGEGDAGAGGWRNFFVGVVGGVGAVEEEVLWPNQILHRDRLLYNARDALDLARFLAVPCKEDMEAHLVHLRRIAEERGHHRGWCWHMLRQRWGEAPLREHGIQA